MRPSPLLVPVLAVVLAACAAPGPDEPIDSDDTPLASAPGAATPVLVVVDGAAGKGMSVAEALTHGPTDDIVSVSGALFVDADGTVRLCDAIAESFPPQCGGERIEVTGLDLDGVEDLEEANGVRWAEAVTLMGSVE
jgi:hypothetical protein